MDAGLLRGPASEVQTAQDPQEIGRLKARLEVKDKKLRRFQEELARERRKLAAFGKASLEMQSARKHVREGHGCQHGLPVLDLTDALPGFKETVSIRGQWGDASPPSDVALLKGLARGVEGYECVSFGPWRGEVAANVAAIIGNCVSVNLSDVDPAEPRSLEGTVAERATLGDDAGGVSYRSFVFDVEAFGGRVGLACIDGRGEHEVGFVTRSISRMLSEAGVVVWRGYMWSSGEIDWRVLSGILDGWPEAAVENLFHISGTSCAAYLPGIPPGSRDRARRKHSGVIDVSLSARQVPRRLVILDDAFPNLHSAFRIAEYNAYLQRWPDATVYSTAQNRVSVRNGKGFGQILDDYAALYPELSSRIFRFGGEANLGRDLAYFIFLGNAARFASVLDANDTPFAFTLYPGGGFKIDEKDSDEVLRRTCSSPNFEKVIATQTITREYLIDGGFCDPEKIEFVYGGVFPLADLADQTPPKVFYKDNKDTFDLCFVAYKYTNRSIVSKGYDVFVEVAKRLSKRRPDARFHVVGTFDESDIDVSDISEKVTFYGPRTSSFFPGFYSRMDMILSHNVPFTLLPGAFDGFPTGSCMEAGLCGVAVVCTDPLGLNVAFEDGEEILIVPHDAEATVATAERYMDSPDELYDLAKRGQRAFARVFGMEAQMEPRLRMLSELLGEEYTPNGGSPNTLPVATELEGSDPPHGRGEG